MLRGWLRARVDGLMARLGERVDQAWSKRVRENFYDPVRERQMSGDLLDPDPQTVLPPDSPEGTHPCAARQPSASASSPARSSTRIPEEESR